MLSRRNVNSIFLAVQHPPTARAQSPSQKMRRIPVFPPAFVGVAEWPWQPVGSLPKSRHTLYLCRPQDKRDEALWELSTAVGQQLSSGLLQTIGFLRTHTETWGFSLADQPLGRPCLLLVHIALFTFATDNLERRNVFHSPRGCRGSVALQNSLIDLFDLAAPHNCHESPG